MNKSDQSWKTVEQEFDTLLRAMTPTGESDDYNKDVRSTPKHGVYFRWPEDGSLDWVHPEDRDLAVQMMPGSRIFVRDQCDDAADRDNGYFKISYGETSIRVQPAMWLRVDFEGYEVGDRVEVKSNHGRHHPVIGNICDIKYDPTARRSTYTIEVNGFPLAKKFTREDFRPCRKLGKPLSVRETELLIRDAIGGF